MGRFSIARSYVGQTKGEYPGILPIDQRPLILQQTAEIIALLYEATQGPPLPINEPPALNPTGTSLIPVTCEVAHP